MSLVVVRCPACREAARVPVDALQQMVACPRCESPFVAEEDVPVEVLPSHVNRAARRSEETASIDPPRRRRPRPPRDEELELFPSPAKEVPDPEHDPHLPPVAGLPVTVLVGFALVPFGIPLLWFIGPMITGRDASLSLAVPVSLALAAAALCLGVVYTIDWSAATRIKGVVMLVGLAYFAAAGLYFIKKDAMEGVEEFFGKNASWNWVQSDEGNFSIKMPGNAWPANSKADLQPLPHVEMVEAWQASCQTGDFNRNFIIYNIASSKPMPPPFKADDAWFAKIGAHLKKVAIAGQMFNETRILSPQGHSGRQWEFNVARRNTGVLVRIVQVFVIDGRVYYLSAEGPNLSPANEEFAKQFFGSFGTN